MRGQAADGLKGSTRAARAVSRASRLPRGHDAAGISPPLQVSIAARKDIAGALSPVSHWRTATCVTPRARDAARSVNPCRLRNDLRRDGPDRLVAMCSYC